MAKVYLIGGTPRVGKTTLTLRAIEKQPMLATSIDAIRYTLRKVIPEEQEPDLFHMGKYTSNDSERINALKNNPEHAIEVQNKESVVVWKSVKEFINSNMEDGFDILLEGAAILPEFVDSLEHDKSVVYLGNQSEKHFEIIRKAARSNPNDWMHSLSDEAIEAFCVFNQTFGNFIEKESTKYNQTYIEMSDEDFEASIEKALSALLQD